VDAAPLVSALRSLSFRVGAAGEEEPAALTVVLTDDYLRAGLRAHNAEALALGRPWLLAKPAGRNRGPSQGW